MFVVIGGGLQGACAALEIAARGHRVTIVEERDALVAEASRWNEGKLHLGYVYANDPSGRTARAMLDGSLSFRPLLERHLEQRIDQLVCRPRFHYAIPHDSMLPPSRVVAHFAAVDDMLAARGAWWKTYADPAGTPGSAPVPVSPLFDDRRIARAVTTPEVSVDVHAIADLVAARLAADPRIEILLDTSVAAVTRAGARFHVRFARGGSLASVACVVNASWRSRLLIDQTVGYPPPRPWLHRYKVAIRVRGATAGGRTPSVTFVTGAFGDVVNFADGRMYLSWYPACKLTTTARLTPDPGSVPLGSAQADDVRRRTVDALGALVPALRDELHGARFAVKGCWIFAWGSTDITDMASALHARDEVGVFSDRGYHSINTGKFGMAPRHAQTLAARLFG